MAADENGVLQRFYGPDGVALLWVDFGAGRVSLYPPDTGAQFAEHQEAEDPHGDRAYVDGLKGKPLGLATLDGNGTLTLEQLPPSASESSIRNFDATADTTIPLPALYAVNGRSYRVYARAMGGQRVITFHTDYRLSAAVTSRAFTVPANQILCAEAQYSSLSASWILVQATVTTGTGGQTPPGSGGDGTTGSVPTVNAGADAQIDAEETLTRVATDTDNGSAVYERVWTILSGPLGEGTTIGTDKNLSWVPGSSPAGTTDIRQPVCQEMAWQINSTAENGTLDWTTAYRYIEDIDDDRGYTAGLVGFTSGTGDMLLLVQEYTAANPSNPLASYIPGLQTCAQVGFGPNASAAASTNLGTAFMTAWRNAADNDPVFRKVQRDFRKRVYWDDALAQALVDGLSPLGLALYVDVLVNHGIGNDPQSFGGLLAAARAANPTPKQGGSEATYLLKLCDLRDAVLQDWGDYQVNGRSSAFRALISTGNFSLLGPVTWSIYGDTYTMNRPAPKVDSRIGTYTLRYAATNAVGRAHDDLVVTVTGVDGGTGPEDPGGTEKLLSTLQDNFDDNVLSTTLWTESYPTTGATAPTEVGGRARVPCFTDYSAYLSNAEYKLAGSHALVRVYPPEKGTGTDVYASMAIESASAPEGTTLSIMVNTGTGNIRFSHNTDYWDNNAVSIAYNATSHAWVRIREASGTVYWETSPDGITWTSRRTMATPAWVASATDMSVSLSSHRNAGTANYAEFDNFNVTS
ncbi:chitosanase [Streptomyces althioticus]|uniref:chitosanase n=1 Tax=Streptomyces althioticus TaxID=83380 RepID=UPI0033FE2FC7